MQRVRELMTDNPVLVQDTASVAEAMALAAHFDVHHLLVVDQEHLVGVTCLCDLSEFRSTAPLSGLVRSAFLFVDPDAPVEGAATMMRRGHVGCLPVIDGAGELLGVLTRRDLRRAGALGADRGIDCCAGCGDSHGLAPAAEGSELVFCRECRERARPRLRSISNTTLGGCD